MQGKDECVSDIHSICTAARGANFQVRHVVFGLAIRTDRATLRAAPCDELRACGGQPGPGETPPHTQVKESPTWQRAPRM